MGRSAKKWRPNLVAQTIEKFLRTNKVTGKIVSVGAGAREWDMLNVSYFRESPEKFELVGINIDPTQLGSYGNFEVIEGDGHAMPFEDASLDGIICNAMLEHDPQFWLTVAEMQRVVKPGGFVLIGVPGFTGKHLSVVHRLLPGHGAVKNDVREATMTYIVHNAPGDYYRFSEQAMKEVLLGGLESIQMEVVMKPPRVIGWGVKPKA
ncbi:MAG: class I SAM-dependent methyltransferase [Planctomycetota bacterium]